MTKNVGNQFGVRHPQTQAAEALIQNEGIVPTTARRVNDFIGVEVEIEGTADVANVSRILLAARDSVNKTHAQMARLFEAKIDGSLRNRGVEFITVPIHVTSLQGLLEFLYRDIIRTHYPRATFSERCGIHIHCDVSRMDINQILMFTMIYSIYEKEFFKLSGIDRIDSNFCVPIRNQSPWTWFPDATDRDNYGVWNRMIPSADQGKYSAMNFTRMRDIGTVEFRHLPGTFNIDLIVKFALCIQRMKEYAMNKKIEESFFKTLDVANTVSCYRQLTDDIFKELSFIIWPNDVEYNDIEIGITFAKKLKWLSDNYVEINKPIRTLTVLQNPSFGKKLEKFLSSKNKGGTPAKKRLGDVEEEDYHREVAPLGDLQIPQRQWEMDLNALDFENRAGIFNDPPIQNDVAQVPEYPVYRMGGRTAIGDIRRDREGPHARLMIYVEKRSRARDGNLLNRREWMWLTDYHIMNGEDGVVNV